MREQWIAQGDAEGAISAFIEKPPAGTAPCNYINAGTYLLEREVLDAIPPGRPVSIERETFPQLIASGKRLYAYRTRDYWIDLGRPEQYLAAHRDVLSGAMPLIVEPGLTGDGAAAIDRNAIVEPVHVDAGVVIDPTATVGPNAVLGRGCRVGRGNRLRRPRRGVDPRLRRSGRGGGQDRRGERDRPRRQDQEWGANRAFEPNWRPNGRSKRVTSCFSASLRERSWGRIEA